MYNIRKQVYKSRGDSVRVPRYGSSFTKRGKRVEVYRRIGPSLKRTGKGGEEGLDKRK